MTAHDHREFVAGCFRCDLSSGEYAHEADCSWAIGESDECSCGLDNLLLLAIEVDE